MIWEKEDLVLMENLKKQYEENLTQEQKYALIRYNSSLFIFFNKIVSINGYESMSIDEIYILMKPFIEKYSYVIRNLTLFMNMKDSNEELLKEILSSVIDEDVIVYDSIVEKPDKIKILDKTSEKYILHGILKILVEEGVVSPTSFNFDNLISCREAFNDVYDYQYFEAKEKLNTLTEARLEKIYKKLIANLMVDIKTIKGIPEDTIVLPKDIIVYRGLTADDEIDTENLSESDFVSTTLSKAIATKYITKREGNNDALLSIKLLKDTPVFVFPQTVKNDGFWAHNLFLSDDMSIFEIMFDKTRVKNFTIIYTETLETKKVK